MALPKPSSHLDWTDGSPSKQVEPSGSKKLLGWVALERPPFEYMNYLFWEQDNWNKYFESVTDETAYARVDAIVDKDGNGNFLDLQSAHDSGDVTTGSIILITSDLLLDATVTISKPGIEIRQVPGRRIKKGPGAPLTNFTGIQVLNTADRSRFMHLGFGSATSGEKFGGSGDKAIDLQAGVDDVFIFNPQFVVGNTVDLSDNSTTTLIVGPQANMAG